MKIRTFLLAAGFSWLALASSYGGNIYQTANDTSSDTWSTDGAPWGGTAPSAGNDYFTVAGVSGTASQSSGFGANYSSRLRDTGSIFGGDSLTIVADTEVLLKGGAGSVTTGDLILNGGIIALGNGTTITVNLAGNLAVPTTGILGAGSANTVNVDSTLTGSGTLSLRSSDTTPTLRFSGDLSGFNGTFQIGGGNAGYVTVVFNQDYNLSAAITMGTLGGTLDVLNLSHALTVNSFQFGATILSAATYTVAQLNGLVGNGSQFTGTGTLTTGSTALKPTIGVNPIWSPTSVAVGQTASITVIPTGTTPFAYQWRAGVTNSGNYINLINGGNLSGATNATLTINNTQFTNALDYVVVVTNIYGAITSSVPARLTVLAPAPVTTFTANGLALTPPMGWNAWNYFQHSIDETIVRAIADAMATNGMKDAGYQYINLDDMWQKSRDANGVIQVDPIRFPSGMKALADYVHSKGLKFGLYSDHGLQTCQDRPGTYGYEYTDANTYASWGVDYLKYDNCVLPSGDNIKNDYALMADALLKTGRPITYSICSWSFNSWQPYLGNLWRTTGDIGSTFASIAGIPARNSTSAFFAGPGHWNDPDMLEIGNGNMTFIENQSHFSLWCLMAAPLLAGNDLTTMSAQTASILNNAELIAVDQDPAGEQGVALPNTSTNQIWVKPLGAGFTTKAVGLFNPNASTSPITVNWIDIGLQAGSATVRDLWAGANLGSFNNSFTTNVPAHATVVLKVVGTAPLVPGLGSNYLSDLQFAYGYVGSGVMTKDKSIGGNAIKLNGVTYPKGLGVHAFSGVEYRLGGVASRFQSDIGVDDEAVSPGSVVFHVIADGIEIYSSGTMNVGTAHKTINLDVTGVNRLTLGVSDADNGNSNDHADWAGAFVVVTNTVHVAPSVPTGLSASPGLLITLSWNVIPGAASYNIYRALAPMGPYTNLTSSVLSTYSDTNVVSGTTYYYQVSAVSGYGESSNSVAASAYACVPPAIPSGVTTVAQRQQVIISWNPVFGATSYSVARATLSTPFSLIASGVTATNNADNNVALGSHYSYVVMANNGCSLSGPSTCAYATPALPVGYLTTLQTSRSNLTLAWPQGTFQQATNLTGPWIAQPGISSNTVGTTNAQMFFRLLIQAHPISINFSGSGTAMASSERAGVVPETNWNNASGAIVVNAMPLKDVTGSPNGATLEWLAKSTSINNNITDTAGNNRMMRSLLDISNANFDTATAIIEGLPANPGGWDVYVYFDGSNGTETREGSYMISGPGITTTTVLAIDAANVNFSGTFTQANNSAGNYVLFSIPNVPGFVVDATPYRNGAATLRAPINGIQIIPK
jgi:alpha-galactosidase